MAQTKYVVFKNQDAQKYLSPEQKQQLLGILRTVLEGRRADNRSTGDLFFVLNMKDQYACVALDSYISAVQNDGISPHNKDVTMALETALNVKMTAALTVTPGLPT